MHILIGQIPKKHVNNLRIALRCVDPKSATITDDGEFIMVAMDKNSSVTLEKMLNDILEVKELEIHRSY